MNVGKPLSAHLTLESDTPETATFSVEFTGRKNQNKYNFWVALNGYDETDHRSASYGAVNWSEADTNVGGVTLAKQAGDPNYPAETWEAFVVIWPDVWTPASNEVVL